MRAFELPPGDSDELWQRLFAEHRVEVPVYEWEGRRLLRVSVGPYNDEDDIDRLVSALDDAPVIRKPFAWAVVLPVAFLELVVQVAFANGYGYHRDELYFRAAGRHPAFGYDDQPPLTPLLGRVSEAMFGETPRGLRVLSAVAVAVVIVLVALLARELGAGRAGQLVAAASTAASAFVVVVGHLLSTSTFDLLLWTARRPRSRDDPRRPRPAPVGRGRARWWASGSRTST